MVSPINPRFPATIYSPKNVIKNDDFSRTDNFIILMQRDRTFLEPVPLPDE